MDFCRGIRVPYLKPVAFFLLSNILFFLLVVRVNTFSLPLYNYITFTPFTYFHTGEHLGKKLKKESITYKQYENVFNEKMKSSSKVFIIIFIPFMAFMSALVFISKKKKIGRASRVCHAFYELCTLSLVSMSLVTYILFSIFNVGYSDAAVTLVTLILISIYLFFSVSRFYSTGIIGESTSALLIAVFFLTFMQIYRILLFFKILYIG